VVAFFAELFEPSPTGASRSRDVAEGDGVAVRWRARATFAGPGNFMGFEPNGARVDSRASTSSRPRRAIAASTPT
jgi:hypothetical protein